MQSKLHTHLLFSQSYKCIIISNKRNSGFMLFVPVRPYIFDLSFFCLVLKGFFLGLPPKKKTADIFKFKLELGTVHVDHRFSI